VSVLAEFAVDTKSFDPDAIVSSWCGRTLIRSSAALSYKKAQAIVDDRTGNSAIASSLRDLQNIGRALLRSRKQNGALEVEVMIHFSHLSEFFTHYLQSFETEFEVSGEDVGVAEDDHVEFHSTVAELMIFANRVVAERIHAYDPSRALLR
jgi:exoribonuclease R